LLVTDALEKWQATSIVLAAIVALVLLALVRDDVPGELVVGAIGGIPSLVLGAGAVAHGVRQGSKASSDPPAGG
jgi:hypothetical protein